MNFKFSIKLFTVVALSQMTLFCSEDGPVCVEPLPRLGGPHGLCRSVSCPQPAKTLEVPVTGITTLTLPIHRGTSKDISGDIYAPESPSVKVVRTFGDALRDPGTRDDQIARYLAAAESMSPADFEAYQKFRIKTDPRVHIQHLEQEIRDLETQIHRRCRLALDNLSFDYTRRYRLASDGLSFDYEPLMSSCEETIAHLLRARLAAEDISGCFKVVSEPQHLIDILTVAHQEACHNRLVVNKKRKQLEDLRKFVPESHEELVARYMAQLASSSNPYFILTLSPALQESLLAAIHKAYSATSSLMFMRTASDVA